MFVTDGEVVKSIQNSSVFVTKKESGDWNKRVVWKKDRLENKINGLYGITETRLEKKTEI